MNLVKSLLGAAILSTVSLSADEVPELDPEVAGRVIKLMVEEYQQPLQVIKVQEGVVEGKGWRPKHQRRVTVLMPVLEQGRMVRRIRVFDLEWDRKFGWHHQELRPYQGQDRLWIWSETQGEVEVK